MSVGGGRVYHANVNCSDLDRSLAFYTEVLGLTPVAHTAPDAVQEGGAFGLDAARWDAWILGGAGQPPGSGPASGAVVDLLEWKVPVPVVVDHEVRVDDPAGADDVRGGSATGFRAVVLGRQEPADQRRRLQSAGVTVSAADGPIGTGRPGALAFRDPDGTAVEIVGADTDSFTGLIVGCSDVEASLPFYRDVLGFSVEEARAGGAVVADEGGFRVHLRPAGPDARSGRRPANALGIFRVALLTSDIAADHAELRRAGVYCWSGPTELEMGSGLGRLEAMLFADPDGAAWELIQPGNR